MRPFVATTWADCFPDCPLDLLAAVTTELMVGTDPELAGPDRLFPIPRRTVQAEHRRTREIAGISGYTIHDHRHTAAVTLARVGIPLDRIQKQFGHKHITMAMRYAAFHPDYNDGGRYFELAGEGLGLAYLGGHLVGHPEIASVDASN